VIDLLKAHNVGLVVSDLVHDALRSKLELEIMCRTVREPHGWRVAFGEYVVAEYSNTSIDRGGARWCSSIIIMISCCFLRLVIVSDIGSWNSSIDRIDGIVFLMIKSIRVVFIIIIITG